MSVKHRTCPNWQPCKVRISYTFLTHTTPLTKDRYRPQDLDNCRGSLKSAIDGLKDAHIIPDDTAEFVTWGDEALYVRESLSPKYIGKPRVILEIEERA